MSEPHRREDGLPTIGLAVIVKNEEETLPRLLDSLGWGEADDRPGLGCGPDGPDVAAAGFWRDDAAVDCVVVCDTGSSDETVQVAIKRGCRVIKFDWCDDFSAARQASYDALPEVDFTLWADADDQVKDAHKLREIAAKMPPNVAGTLHRYDYAFDEVGNVVCELWRERLVRKGVGEHWELPIHEVLKVPGPLVHSDEVVWVHGHLEERERDPERNYKILLADRKKSEDRDEPPNPRTLAYLGTEALALGRPEEAVECFEAYLGREDANWDEERCQVAHKLSIALRTPREGEKPEDLAYRMPDSANAAYRAIEERPDWADGYIDLADIATRRGDWKAAVRFCDTAMRLDPPRTLLIINPMEYSYQPALIKSVALLQLGELEEAAKLTEQCLAATPHRQDLQAQMAGLQGSLTINNAERLILELREILVRHDENLKARYLMDCVPYFAQDRPAISQARLDQREMTLHATDPGAYESYYAQNPNEAPFEMQGVEIEKAHEAFQRVDFLRRGIKEQAAA